MKIFKVKQKSSVEIFFAITYGGLVLDLSTSTLTLKIYNDQNVLAIQKNDIDFNKTEAVVGEVSVLLNEIDLDLDAGTYTAYLKIEVGTMIDKTLQFKLLVESSPLI